MLCYFISVIYIFKGTEIVACIDRSVQDLMCNNNTEKGIILFGINVDNVNKNISVVLVSSGLSFAGEKSSRPLMGVGLVHVFQQS
jgi:hypothetical protein